RPSTSPSARSGSCSPAASGRSATPTSMTTTREPTMPCPDLGALRAALDALGASTAAPDGPPPAPLHDHVQTCASCSDTLAELQRNAELAALAIALTAPAEPPNDAAVEAARARLERGRGG